jgi:DNA-binding XRE family transcriptional regulator
VKKLITIKAFKKKHGATKAAALAGVTTKALWSWETGRTAPKGNDARRLAELGVRLA